jgi:asparagine N-glycosylation enzyme membrane subunit Stt3
MSENMSELEIVQWLIVVGVLFVVPFWRIIKRTGFKPAWALLALVPGGILVLLWVLAFAKWPTFMEEKKE